MKSVLVPATDRARCIACGENLFPEDGPREVFVKFDEQTKSTLLSCDRCRKNLPGAWSPAVIEKNDTDHLRVEPTASASEIDVDIAQQVISDVFKADDNIRTENPIPPEPERKVFILKRKTLTLRSLIRDAAERAKCYGEGFVLLPGDMMLVADEQIIREGDIFPGTKLKIFRDRELLTGESYFLRVGSEKSIRKAGLLGLVLFKTNTVAKGKPIRPKDMVRKMELDEKERCFILNIINEN